MEVIQDAKRRKKEITVCWLDLANAYGSVSHNLIQFAAEWYHVPETLRNIIFSYYDDLAVKISTDEWTTNKISYEQGLFQGFPLSVVLFLMVFQICLNQLSVFSSHGYKVGAGPTQNQRAYADDLTLIAKSRISAELMLKTVEKFLRWSVTMKAKPTKCRSLSLAKIPGTSSLTPSDPGTIHPWRANPVHSPGTDEIPGPARLQGPFRHSCLRGDNSQASVDAQRPRPKHR